VDNEVKLLSCGSNLSASANWLGSGSVFSVGWIPVLRYCGVFPSRGGELTRQSSGADQETSPPLMVLKNLAVFPPHLRPRQPSCVILFVAFLRVLGTATLWQQMCYLAVLLFWNVSRSQNWAYWFMPHLTSVFPFADARSRRLWVRKKCTCHFVSSCGPLRSDAAEVEVWRQCDTVWQYCAWMKS
jgi:hypothetical protein